MKMIELSNSDFKSFINENKYYVDKTLLIEDLFSKGSQVVLLPRPRRFGKTLNLSILKYYFDISEDSRNLFKGLKIEKSKIFKQYLNRYPIIFLTLKEIEGHSWEEIYGLVKLAISNLYKAQKYLLESDKLDNYDKDIINKIIKGTAESQYYKTSLKMLSEYLYMHYKKEVVILLGEYDTPVNSIYNKEIYDNILSFIKVLR